MKLVKFPLLCLLASMALASCVKQAYDNPPDTAQYDPNLPVNCTIEDLANGALNLASGQYRMFGDTTITGIVVADDRSGNIYKKLFIQDSSGYGISLLLDKTYLYGDYPVGRKIYVKLSGLYILNYNGTPEIISSVDPYTGNAVGIPSVLVTKYVVKASYPHPVVPTTVDASDLIINNQRYCNVLIKLDGMQFDDISKDQLYSFPSSSTNRYLTNCDKSILLDMYNSSFATFQAAVTPNGNGSIVGIITLYAGKPELILRDTTDVHFTGVRCP